MGINSTEVSYGFGQMGSVFTDTANAAITPPTDKVFVAITFLADTQLELLGTNAGGLTADTSDPNAEYIGTDVAAHNLTAGNETAISGAGGKILNNADTFPKGVTIYGRFTTIQLASGLAIAYLGY